MNEHLRNWIIYLCWLVFFEIITFCIILFVFPLEQLEWWHFLAIQPINYGIALVFFVFTLAVIDSVKAEEKRNEWYKRVNKMLKDFEEKEKKMNKGLEALEELFNAVASEFDGLSYMEDFEKCKCVIEKELKALEIIRDKNVNTEMIKLSKDYFEYDAYTYKTDILTQEEYDILKEALL